nr:aminodeoxychorismate/anthranilate synthase component II [uncultured Solibaculum sp.]
MILLIDNYDSFSYNLVQMLGCIRPDIHTVRNDKITVEEVKELAPSHIILSPGPGYPKDAGICENLVIQLAGQIPILGVCLGHQAICEAFGGKIIHAVHLMHGKQSQVSIRSDELIFKGLGPVIQAARYHSLAADRQSLPEQLCIIGEDPSGEIMAVRHRNYPVYGLQFHPESILTPQGDRILANFLNMR